jgi:hypothetical protein
MGILVSRDDGRGSRTDATAGRYRGCAARVMRIMGTVPRTRTGRARSAQDARRRTRGRRRTARRSPSRDSAWTTAPSGRSTTGRPEIQPGTVVAIIGPNGSGKSTLLSTLSGLVRPTRGEVEILGVPVGPAATSPTSCRRRSRTRPSRSPCARPSAWAATGPRARSAAPGRGPRAPSGTPSPHAHRGPRRPPAARAVRRAAPARLRRPGARPARPEVLLLDEPITGLDLVTQETITEVIAPRSVTAGPRRADHPRRRHGPARRRRGADGDRGRRGRATRRGAHPANLALAYGGHVHVLDDGTVVLDEPHHHDHRHHDQLGS